MVMTDNKTRPVTPTSDNKTNSMWKVTDYVNEVDRLQKQLEEVKANADYQIEGRDLEIAELKQHLSEEIELHLHAESYIKSLEEQIEKMKVCSNCKHFNNVEDLEYCQNCERQLVNSLDKLPREEIIKDEWELKE